MQFVIKDNYNSTYYYMTKTNTNAISMNRYTLISEYLCIDIYVRITHCIRNNSDIWLCYGAI